MNLKGKTVVVTGAGSGLGLGTCQVLAAAGAHIAAFDINGRSAAAVEKAAGPDVLFQAVDVANAASVETGINAALGRFGAIHAAVNCAGVSSAAKTVSKGRPYPLDDWNRVIAINLTGTFNVIRFAALAMSRNDPDSATGERGVIINVASAAASQGQVGQAAYSASKAGVVGLTLPVARDLAPHAIRVVTVSPGLFDTGMAAGIPAVAQAILDDMVLYPHRMGRPEEFGRLARHIIENEYLNATTIDFDAGARLATRAGPGRAGDTV
ncbi:MAG: SDR family NAD(P)-dependent oxidoreductase [Hyphomicrobiaceae bacterium]